MAKTFIDEQKEIFENNKVCYKSYALVSKWSEGYLYTILIPRGRVLTPSLSLFGYNNNRKSIRRGV